jgi:hypothetical protein
VPQLHSAEYRNPAQLPAGARVLVVGAANSGLQIAAELADTCSVTVAVGSRPTELPQRIAGRDLFFWLTRSGFFTVPTDSRIARRLRARGDLVIGTRSRELRRRGIAFRPRLTDVTGRTAVFADGSSLDVDAVVWATGTAPTTRGCTCRAPWSDGQIRHTAGVAEVPGLYVIGLPWQTSRAPRCWVRRRRRRHAVRAHGRRRRPRRFRAATVVGGGTVSSTLVGSATDPLAAASASGPHEVSVELSWRTTRSPSWCRWPVWSCC